MNILKGNNKLYSFTIIFFLALWTLLVLLDYINKHPSFLSSFEYFQYPKLYGFLTALIAIIAFYLKWDKKNKPKVPVNGLSISIFTFVLSIALISAHKDYAFSPTSFDQVLEFQMSAWALILMIFLLVMILKSAGKFLHLKFLSKHFKKNYVLDLGIGFMLFIIILFLFGLFGIFNAVSILILLLIFAGLNLFDLIRSLKDFFFKRIDIKNFNRLGIVSFCILLYFILLNALSVYGPYPSGFDSRNFYMNVSQLIAEDGALVKGYQPYYWSIFMAVGYSLFGKAEMAMELSILGMVLTIIASYRFAVSILKLDKNIVLFCLCLFIVTPAVTNQLYTELKVDFALLFYQILCVEYLILLFKRIESKEENEGIKSYIPLAILVGVLCGFGLGIKIINMFLVFVILVLIWWNYHYKIGIVASISFSLLLFLVAGIDDISGLSKYHLGHSYVKLALAFIWIVSCLFLFYRHRKYFLKKAIISVVVMLSTGIFVAPWIIKNYTEWNSLNPKVLLMGKDPGPKLGLRKIIDNYEKQQELNR